MVLVLFSSLKNTAGHDRAGMLFALVAIASHTRDGHAAFSRLDDNVTSEISYAIEMLLYDVIGHG
eukprot:scaffold56715_cov36-Attheya_sp.AAC.3